MLLGVIVRCPALLRARKGGTVADRPWALNPASDRLAARQQFRGLQSSAKPKRAPVKKAARKVKQPVAPVVETVAAEVIEQPEGKA
jgi:hypothetical protein